MATISDALEGLMCCDGALAAAVVDPRGPRILGRAGRANEIELAAAAHAAVLQAEFAALTGDADATVDDVLITQRERHHLLRPCAGRGGVFVLLVLERPVANLALARRCLREAEAQL